MKYKQLRTQILFIIISMTIFLLTVVNIYNYYDRKEILYNISIEKLLILTKVIRNFEKEQLVLYRGRSQGIQNNNSLIDAIMQKNAPEIAQDFNKIFSRFKQETPKLMHMHLYSIDTSLLYAHKPKEAKQLLHAERNEVLKEAFKKKKIVKGYVVIENKTFFYSIVYPLRKNGKIIAYLEYGIKPDNIFKIASKAGRYKYALYLHPSHTTTLHRDLGIAVAENSHIFENLKIDQDFVYKYANENKLVKYKDNYYLFHQYDIETRFQKDFAQVIMASNVTRYIEENQHKTFMTILLSLAALSIIYINV